MRKRSVKRYAGKDESLVEIEERSTKSPRLIEEEKAKAPDDYAGLGGRMKPTPAPSTWSGPREYITESKEESVEPESVAGKGARNLALEETKRETVKALTKKKPVAKKAPSYEDTGAKIGSQSFNFESKSEPATRSSAESAPVARTRAGTPVKGREEPKKEDVDRAMSSLNERLKKQYQENTFNFKPSKNPNRSYKSGGKTSSASSRADGIASRGKTRGRIC